MVAAIASAVEDVDGSPDYWPGPVAGLRACMSDNVTTPDAVAQVAVEHWLGDPMLREMLLGRWHQIGVGHDWGCPMERGVVLVVLLAGRTGVEGGAPRSN